MSVQMRPNEDHEVLGSEFCSGYIDSFGKWNTGFYCPTIDSTEAVYCCGTNNYKYCCTKKDEVQQEIPNLLLVLGVIAGIATAILVVTLVSCFFCSCCILYKRRQSSLNGGPLYQMHCSSTGSGVANMYSFSNQNSSVTTPVDTAGPHPLDLIQVIEAVAPGGDSPQSHVPHSFTAGSPQHSRFGLEEGGVPSDPLEDTNEQLQGSLSPCFSSSPSVSITLRDQPSSRGRPSDPQVSYSPNQNNSQRSSSPAASTLKTSHSSIMSGQAPMASPPKEEIIYWSTKF